MSAPGMPNALKRKIARYEPTFQSIIDEALSRGYQLGDMALLATEEPEAGPGCLGLGVADRQEAVEILWDAPELAACLIRPADPGHHWVVISFHDCSVAFQRSHRSVGLS